MSLFVCDTCGCVENTATSNYWRRRALHMAALCSQCDPEIAKWHGLFRRKEWDGERPMRNRPESLTQEDEK